MTWLNAVEARKELDGGVGINWPANPLRDSLSRLSEARKVAIWLDRRIDPDQQVQFKVREVPLREGLRQLANQLNAGVCLVGPVVYIGPRHITASLTKVSADKREEMGKLAEELRRKSIQAKPWQWDELAEPRELLGLLAAEGGLKLAGGDQLPHDLWPAGDLPALPLADRLSLLLAGFDQSFELSADGALRLVPFPQSAAVERQHAVKGDVKQAAEKIAQLFPTAKIRTAPGKLFITAGDDEHKQIEDFLKGSGRPAPAGQTRYTLTMDQPVGRAAQALAKELGMELKLDPAITPDQLKQQVSFKVKDVTLEGLFKGMFDPVGLAFKINGKTLEVSPKQ